MNRVSTILRQYISERIPKFATNIFYQLFNAVEGAFLHLEYRLDIFKRERNILTAQHLSSLRNLAAQNGYEPVLKASSKGILLVKIKPKLYGRCGYPLFIKPYSVFINKASRMEYTYVYDKTIRMDDASYYIPVVEGRITSQTEIATGDYIQRVYISNDYIAEGSILVEVGGVRFEEVKSFYNNEGVNDNKQFMVKFSSDSQNPIILYIKGLNKGESIKISYRLTNGEMGNLPNQQSFETEDIVDMYGSMITPAEDEIEIINVSGFNFGSNGTDENSLRAAIGYNHNINLLFDNISYRNFLSKFSTILVQDIKINKELKQINNVYLWRKNTIIENNNTEDTKQQYKDIVDFKKYLLSESEKAEINSIISDYEYCLSSHNLYNPKTCNYALQIMFDTVQDLNNFKSLLEALIYSEFGKFFYIRHHSINLETLFDNFKNEYNCNFEYILFNQLIEEQKIQEKTDIDTPYIIYHTVDGNSDYALKSIYDNKNYIQNVEGPYLPILRGDFNICDSEFKPYKLFFDINFVVKTTV